MTRVNSGRRMNGIVLLRLFFWRSLQPTVAESWPLIQRQGLFLSYLTCDNVIGKIRVGEKRIGAAYNRRAWEMLGVGKTSVECKEIKSGTRKGAAMNNSNISNQEARIEVRRSWNAGTPTRFTNW